MTGRLSSKVALVTGGAMGLGKAIARRLKAEGAEVIVTDSNADEARRVAEADGFFACTHDVRYEEEWHRVLELVQQRCGALSILVNNAGILGSTNPSDPLDISSGNWSNVLQVNLIGTFLGCRVSLPLLARTGNASIVNLSSIAALRATPQAMAYGASKAGVWNLTKSLAQYCAQRGIAVRCNSILPGNVMTPLWQRYAETLAADRGIKAAQVLAEVGSAIPLGGMTHPDDVAAAVAFLASDDSRHITGSQVVVDGGIVGCEGYQPRGAHTGIPE